MKTFSIVQISDIHIGDPDEKPYETDVRKNFTDILDAAAEEKPDYLVLSGDLCFREAKRDIYRWIKGKTDESGIPYSVLPGNHDETEILAEVFAFSGDVHEGELYYRRELAGRPVLFLDSSRGRLSGRQLSWLDQEFSRIREEARGQNTPTIIFIHHPPTLAGVRHMDRNYALEDIPEIQELLRNSSRPLYIFCGHYHVEKVVMIGNIPVFLTPSTFFQIYQDSEDFKVDHSFAGWRKIRLLQDRLETTARYLLPPDQQL